MLLWYLRVLGAVLAFAVAPRTDAAVLCARPTKAGTFDTTVKIRDVCRRGETQLDPAALGFCCSTPTSTSAPTTTTVTTTSTTTTLGHCAFKDAPCTSDTDCGVPGSCAQKGTVGRSARQRPTARRA
jgi:hypothetical protein